MAKADGRQCNLLEGISLPEPIRLEPMIKRPRHPIWTENKARLIERYLRYFVMITKHGTYIDGFAGPQEPGQPEMWAAKLVMGCGSHPAQQSTVEHDSARVTGIRRGASACAMAWG